MNPLFNQFNNCNDLPINEFMKRFEQFKRNFSGDPRQEVQKMLNNGQLSQAQFNKYAQMANQISAILAKNIK